MASKSTTFLACFLLLNLIFCTMVSACGDCPKPKPNPKPKPTHGSPNPKNTCLKNALQIKLCANVLGLLPIGIGKSSPCCSLIDGLVDLDAAICLCTAVKLNALGIINLNIPVDLSVYFNQCGRKCPQALKHCA